MESQSSASMEVVQKEVVKTKSKKDKRKMKNKKIRLRYKTEKKHQKRLRQFVQQQYMGERKSAIGKVLARKRRDKKFKQMAEQIILDMSALKMDK